MRVSVSFPDFCLSICRLMVVFVSSLKYFSDFVVFSGLDISFTVSVILISMIIVAYIFSMKRKKERSKSQDEMGQRKTTKLRNG